jgi:hypothetical protein
MYHYLIFCLVVSLFFFHSCGSFSLVLEDDLDSASTTATIDDDLAIDAPTAAIEDTFFTYQMLHLVDSLYLPTGYEDDLRTGFNGEVTALQVTSGSAAFQQVVSNSLHRLLDAPMGGPTNEAFYLRYLEQRKKAYRTEMEPQIGSDEVDFGYFNFREEATMNDEAISKMLLKYADTTRLYEPQTVPVTKNLGLTAQGVEFIYLPYKINTRGNGQLNITLPLDTLLISDLPTPYERTLLERLR